MVGREVSVTRKLVLLALVTCVAMGTAGATAAFAADNLNEVRLEIFPWSEETIAAADNAIIDAGYVKSFGCAIPYDIDVTLTFSLPAAVFVKEIHVYLWEYLSYGQDVVENSQFAVVTDKGEITAEVSELSREIDMERSSRELAIVLPEAVRREDIKSFKLAVGDPGEYDYYEMEVNAADIWGGGE
jgi:hypothetical protein